MTTIARPYLVNPRPLHLETLNSYSARLLAANFETDAHRRQLIRTAQVTNPTTSPESLWAGIIESKTGRDMTRLLPAAAPTFTHTDGGTCKHCTAGLSDRFLCTLCAAGATVQQHRHLDSNVCLRHHRWVGPTTTPDTQEQGGPELIRAERTFLKLHRSGTMDPAFFDALRAIRKPLPAHDFLISEDDLEVSASEYVDMMKIAGAITRTAFTIRFFDPSHTFAEAHTYLRRVIDELNVPNPTEVTRRTWLYFRPTFLSIRESLEAARPFAATAAHDFPLSPTIVAAYGHPSRPLEPFERYLAPTGDSQITTQNFQAVLLHRHAPTPTSARPGAVQSICRRGHRSTRIEYVLRKRARVGRDNCPVCEHREVLAGYNDMATTHPRVAKQFHPTKNLPHTPQNTFAASHDMFHWVCGHGDEFEATASNRSSAKTRCPVCLNRLIVRNINDLKTVNPRLASQWHPTLNNRPLDKIAPGSNYKAWWSCPRDHRFQKPVGERTRGANCHHCEPGPELTDRSIACARPDLAAEWDYAHPGNKTLTPDDVLLGSTDIYHWVCRSGHEYAERPIRLHNGFTCPKCKDDKRRLDYLSGNDDVAARFPDIAAEWHPAKNGPIEPVGLRKPGTRQFWWRCLAHAHEERCTVRERDELGGCSKCEPSERARRS